MCYKIYMMQFKTVWIFLMLQFITSLIYSQKVKLYQRIDDRFSSHKHNSYLRTNHGKLEEMWKDFI